MNLVLGQTPKICFWGFPYDNDALRLVYSAHNIVYFESNLTKDCLIWQNFLFWTKFNQNYRFFTRIYPQHYETLLDDRCGYKQLHKLNTVIVQGAPLCIKYNFSSYIFICFNTKAGLTSWSLALWTIWFSLLPFSPAPVSPQTRNIKYKIYIILYHIIWQFNWVIWLNFLLYFGRHFHFLSMSCIEIFIHSTLNYWCWILSFLFFSDFLTVNLSDICKFC